MNAPDRFELFILPEGVKKYFLFPAYMQFTDSAELLSNQIAKSPTPQP